MQNAYCNALLAQSITYKVEEKTILKNINFCVNPNEALWVKGENGSGKSTLLKILSGLITSSYFSGQLIWNNTDLTNTNNFKNYIANTGYFSTKLGIKPNLTVIENILYWTALMNDGHSKVVAALTEFNLFHLKDLPAKFLSFGQLKRLSLSRIFIKNYKILILDEPVLGIDKQGIIVLETILNRHINSGGLLILVSHSPLSINNINILNLN